MQRINRSAHAPVGAAFFLFLGLAIVPVSLRAAGVQVSFTPRLAAAMDAWQQMAEVFGASYHPARPSELGVVKDLDNVPSNPIDSSVSPRGSEFACLGELEELPGTVLDVPKARAHKTAAALRASPKFESRWSPAANRVALVLASEAIKASFEKYAPAINTLGAMKLETLTRKQLVKSIEKQVFRQSFEPIGEIRSFAVPKSMRVLIHLKRAAAGFSAKTAECKVSAALASARRHECERALLTMPSASPDNSEF